VNDADAPVMRASCTGLIAAPCRRTASMICSRAGCGRSTRPLIDRTGS
jgi:hypothetical protein